MTVLCYYTFSLKGKKTEISAVMKSLKQIKSVQEESKPLIPY